MPAPPSTSFPQTAELKGTVRTLDPGVRDLVERRIGEIADSIARAYGGSAETKYTRMYPVTMNHAREAAVAADVARDIVGPERVNDRAMPLMGGEDFAFMLEARPGAFVFLGMGDGQGLPSSGVSLQRLHSRAMVHRTGCV